VFIADSWAPSGTVRSWSFSPYMLVLWLTFVLAVATVDWVSCSWTEDLIIFAVLRAMDWAHVTVEVSVLFYAKIGFLASIFINTTWAVDMIWWTNCWTV